ncbi:Uncharacterised protein [Vibrio cholerae]|nr:Uncharacterised protein [Vibrio cholerae]
MGRKPYRYLMLRYLYRGIQGLLVRKTIPLFSSRLESRETLESVQAVVGCSWLIREKFRAQMSRHRTKVGLLS